MSNHTVREARTVVPARRAPTRGQLLARPHAVGVPAATDDPPHLRASPPDRPPATAARVPDRPQAARLAELLVRLTDEVAAGRRPLAQLDRVLAPSLARRVVADLRPGRPRPQEPLRIVRSLAGAPTPSGAVEATVVIERAGRVSAIAVRLERHHGAWRATELTAPEAGYRPLPTRSRADGRRPDAFDEAAAEAAAAEAAAASAAASHGVSPDRGSA